MTNLPRTQRQNILEYMEKVGPITPIEALNTFGCFRLSGRILELRKEGHEITTEFVKTPNGSHHARYSLKT